MHVNGQKSKYKSRHGLTNLSGSPSHVMYMWLMYSIISQAIIADSGLKTGNELPVMKYIRIKSNIVIKGPHVQR